MAGLVLTLIQYTSIFPMTEETERSCGSSADC